MVFPPLLHSEADRVVAWIRRSSVAAKYKSVAQPVVGTRSGTAMTVVGQAAMTVVVLAAMTVVVLAAMTVGMQAAMTVVVQAVAQTGFG